MEEITNVALHEYLLGVYGVFLWQVEQFLESKKSLKNYWREGWRQAGKAMIWVGLVVAFDDEILSRYNAWAEIDYHSPMPWMYVLSGFFINIISTKVKKHINNQESVLNE